MKKRIVSFILIIVIILSFAPVTALAETRAEVREHNQWILDQFPTDRLSLEYFTLPSEGVESDRVEIISQAQEITEGIESDYEKARAIHRWVVRNISYNWSFLRDIQAGKVEWTRKDYKTPWETETAFNVLRNRTGICVGFANVTVALLRASGIPAIYSQGITSNGGHEWYNAFVDRRWIVSDSESNHFDMGARSDFKMTWESFHEPLLNSGDIKAYKLKQLRAARLAVLAQLNGDTSVPLAGVPVKELLDYLGLDPYYIFVLKTGGLDNVYGRLGLPDKDE